MNHSCNANAKITFDGTLAVLRARKDIKQGEQVFISYLQNYMPKVVRQESLQKMFYFQCNCDWCSCENEPLDQQICISCGGIVSAKIWKCLSCDLSICTNERIIRSVLVDDDLGHLEKIDLKHKINQYQKYFAKTHHKYFEVLLLYSEKLRQDEDWKELTETEIKLAEAHQHLFPGESAALGLYYLRISKYAQLVEAPEYENLAQFYALKSCRLTRSINEHEKHLIIENYHLLSRQSHKVQ
jgi:hypothetical protein